MSLVLFWIALACLIASSTLVILFGPWWLGIVNGAVLGALIASRLMLRQARRDLQKVQREWAGLFGNGHK